MHTENQKDVFGEVSELLESFINGENVCIFAYGQTGSGKTHTMVGQGGIVPASVDYIFEQQSTPLLMSCYEIHIETVRDLLIPDNEIQSLMTN